MDAFSRKIARNTFFNFLSRITGFLSALCLSIITARMLGPNRFGSYSLVAGTFTIAGLAANLGLSSVAIKYFAEFSGDQGKEKRDALLGYLVKFKLLASFAVIAVLIALARPFAAFYGSRELYSYILISAVGLLPSGFAMLLNSVTTGLQEYRVIARRTLLVAPLNVALAYAALRLGWGITGLIIASIIVNIVEACFYFSILRTRFSLRFNLSLPPEVRQRIRRYNFQVFGIIFLDAIVWQRSEIFFLGKFRSAEEVGFYSLAYGIIEKALLFLPGILSGVLMPAVSELYGRSEGERIKSLYINASRYLLMIALPISLGLVFLARPLIGILFGPAYLPAAPVLSILLISGVFGIVASAGSSVQYGTENQQFILKVGSAVAAGNILLDFLLIPRFGAAGAAIANSCAQIAGVAIGSYQVCRMLKVRFPFPDLAKITLAALSMGPLIIYFTGAIRGIGGIVTAVLGGGLIYCLSLACLRVLSPVELKLLKTIRGRSVWGHPT